MIESPSISLTSVHRVEADGVSVFYRESGPADAPVVLLEIASAMREFPRKALSGSS